MKKLFRKTWFQVVLFGSIIGVLLIFLDAQFNWFNSQDEHKPEKFHGAVEANTSEVYFTRAEYAALKYDFGKAKEGDTIKHKFIVKNSGEEPLFIFSAKGSCDCVALTYSGKAIAPGAEEELSVFFNTKGRKGHQHRTITVSTNTDPAETVLTIEGDVE